MQKIMPMMLLLVVSCVAGVAQGGPVWNLWGTNGLKCPRDRNMLDCARAEDPDETVCEREGDKPCSEGSGICCEATCEGEHGEWESRFVCYEEEAEIALPKCPRDERELDCGNTPDEDNDSECKRDGQEFCVGVKDRTPGICCKTLCEGEEYGWMESRFVCYVGEEENPEVEDSEKENYGGKCSENSEVEEYEVEDPEEEDPEEEYPEEEDPEEENPGRQCPQNKGLLNCLNTQRESLREEECVEDGQGPCTGFFDYQPGICCSRSCKFGAGREARFVCYRGEPEK